MENETTIVIFGGTGDLTKKKLMPALQAIYEKKPIKIIGYARRDYTDETFRETFVDSLPKENIDVSKFLSDVYYHRGDFLNTQDFQYLKERLTTKNVLFYLAVDPLSYEPIVENLNKVGLTDEPARIVVEKPFGEDKTSAINLYNSITKVFKDNQVYIIDHYLGKETVQNILAFRLSNGIFEPIWSNKYISSIQITSVENFGTEGRGGYYDKAGATKDMLQSHILQILAAVAMEPPVSFNPDDLHIARTNLISSLEKRTGENCSDVVFGQYAGYTNDEKVAKDSKTETFVALKTSINNERWSGVPIYIRTGKNMPIKTTEVFIEFKKPLQNLFATSQQSNVLAFRLQPNEGISLKVLLKEPGKKMDLKEISMDFCYSEEFKVTDNSYIKLLDDAIDHDKSLFTSIDEIIASWEFVEGIIDYKRNNPNEVKEYEVGTWGPKDAEEITNRDETEWHSLYPYKCDINLHI